MTSKRKRPKFSIFTLELLLKSLEHEIVSDRLIELLCRSADKFLSLGIKLVPYFVVLAGVLVEFGTFDVRVKAGSGTRPVSGHTPNTSSDGFRTQVDERVLHWVLAQRYERTFLTAWG